MMVGVLRATSEFAKANGAQSGPDIILAQDVTHIGRNVPKQAGLPFPMTLAQVSGKHCQVIGNPQQGYKVHDTSTNGSYIIRDNQSVERVPKNGALPIAVGDILRLSTVPSNNPSAVLEYRLEIATEESRVRKTEGAADEDATPVKRLCMANVSSTPDRDAAEAAKERKLSQLLATNKELQSKLGEARGETEAARKQADAQAAKAQDLAAELAAARQQGEEAVAAAAAAAAERSEAHIKELSDDKAALVQQLTQHLQAVRAQAETNAGLTRELETQQAEVQQLKQQVADAQQSQDEKLQALKASETGLQEQLAAVTAEADEARERLRSSAKELQELRGQADIAGKKQQLADDEITALRQQLVSSQREARDAVTRMGDMEMAMQMQRDELTVNEEHFNAQLQQWRKVVMAQRKSQEAHAATQAANNELAAAVSTFGNAIGVDDQKAATAMYQAVSPLANTGAAQFEGTQHTLEVSSHNPAASHDPANGAAAAGMQAASRSPSPDTAAAAQPVQQPHTAAAPTAELGDTPMEHISAPDAGTQLDGAEPAAEPAGSTAEGYEPGQKVDTMGRLTGLGAADTQANGAADGLQPADSDHQGGDDEADATLSGSQRITQTAAASGAAQSRPAEPTRRLRSSGLPCCTCKNYFDRKNLRHSQLDGRPSDWMCKECWHELLPPEQNWPSLEADKDKFDTASAIGRVGADEADADVADVNTPVGASPADPSSNKKSAAAQDAHLDADDPGRDDGAAAAHADGEGNARTDNGSDDEHQAQDDDEDDEMEED